MEEPKTEVLFCEAVTDAFKSVRELAWRFISDLVNRISPKVVSGNNLSITKTKTILTSLLDDLLSVLFMPEWPAAEVLLHLLTQYLILKVIQKSREQENKRTSSQSLLRLLAVDMLGKVCSEVKRHELLAVENALEIRGTKLEVKENATPHEAGEDASCICQHKRKKPAAALLSLKDDEEEEDKKEDVKGENEALKVRLSSYHYPLTPPFYPSLFVLRPEACLCGQKP